MPKQNFNSGLEKSGPHRQGEKGGKGGTVKKAGVSSSGDSGVGGKAGKGAGTRSGGVSGGKRAHDPVAGGGKSSPEGKGSGNR